MQLHFSGSQYDSHLCRRTDVLSHFVVDCILSYLLGPPTQSWRTSADAIIVRVLMK